MDTVTRTGTDAATTACKKLVQETAGARRDLIRNKIADKKTLASKKKVEKKEMKQIKTINLHTTRKKVANNRWLIKIKWIEVLKNY